MSGAFDPYHKWLGIPPDEQPPDFYRLLSVQQFEDDIDAIEHAADQRMAHLRSMQTGKHADLSQQLLNELSKARVTLLNPEKRAAYDAELRQRLEAEKAAAEAAVPKALPVAKPIESARPKIPPRVAPTVSTVRPATEPKKKSGNQPIILAAAGFAILVLAVSVWVFIPGDKPADTPMAAQTQNHNDHALPARPPSPPPSRPPSPPPAAPEKQPETPAAKPSAQPAGPTIDELAKQGKLSENLLKADKWGVRSDSKLPFDRQGELFAGDNGTDTSLRRSALQQVLLNQASAEPIVATLWSKAEGVSGKADPNYSLYLEFVHTDGTHASARSVAFDVATHDWQRRELLVTPEKPLKKVFVSILFSHHGGKVWFRDPELRIVGSPKAETPVVEKQPDPPEPAPVPETSPPEQPAKMAMPAKADQDRVIKQLEDAYEISKAKKPSEKVELAGRLLELGKQSQNPAERFTVLRKAMELASEGGDAGLMLAAVDAIGQRFDVNPLEVKAKVLAGFASEATTSTQIKSFMENSGGVSDQAIAEEQFELAVNLAEAAYKLSQRSSGRTFRKQAYQRRGEVQKLYDSWKSIQAVLAKLKENPDDPAANLAAGRWYCFEKADWQRGLPYLAKSSDAELKSLAAQELESPPEEPAEQLKLADAWWALAEKRSDNEKDSLCLRAGCWYKALDGQLTSALTKAKVEKRLAEIAKLGRPIPAAPNVRLQPEPIAAGDVAASQLKNSTVGADLIAEDTHKGSAGAEHQNTTYVLRAAQPISLGETAIRFHALVDGNNDAHGQVAFGLDGAKWTPLGVWTKPICMAANLNSQDWQTLFFKPADRETKTKELHINFRHKMGNEALVIHRVEWVKNTRPVTIAPLPAAAKPTTGENLLAMDEHTGIANRDPRAATFRLRSTRPTTLDKTLIRFKAYVCRGLSSNGKIELSLDGAKWAPLGVWNEETCTAATLHTQGWQSMPIPPDYGGGETASLQVRFTRTSGVDALVITHVEWGKGAQPAGDVAVPAPRESAPDSQPDAQPEEGFAPNRWVDLMKSVDFTSDRVEGKWKRMRDKLLVTPSGCARMMLPVKVEGEYDLEVAFSRTAGNGPVMVILPVGPRLCQFVLDDWSGHKSGIELINGEDRSKNSTGKPVSKLASKELHIVLLSVRSAGETAGVEVSLDGKQLIRWTGKQSALSVPLQWMLPELNRPALAALENTTVFESARFRLISGQATAVPHDGKPVKPPTRRYMPLATAGKVFGLKPSVWKIKDDYLRGEPGWFDGTVDQDTNKLADISNRLLTMASRPVTSFEFGFKIKAKHYQTIRVYIDGRRYYYARGGWENSCTRIWANEQKIQHAGKIPSADEWCSLAATLEDDTLKFYYNEQLEYECKVPKGPGGKHVIHAGFASHGGYILLKDFYLETK